jgi:nicotinate-nucleotide adenylyltransferase
MRAILGGTFDPPHIAHLVAGEAAHDQLGVDTVTYVPAGRPWQKAGRLVSEARHRLAMIELAIEDTEAFMVDSREVHRDGWTFTIDTIESYGDEDLILIVGADSARGLPTWQSANEVLELAPLAVVPRPGISRAEVESAVGRPVMWLEMPSLDISGTMLRKRVAEGRSIRFLVPDPVRDYVRDHGLYANQV